MGNKPEKDKAEKYLEAYPDVFADITNVLLLKRQVIRPEELRDGPTQSIYKAESDIGLREQSRDTAKYVEKSGVVIALFGIENQSSVDREMVYRMMGYDYASYKRQMEEEKRHYPVISAVLYFGKRPWNGPLSIRDTLELP